MEQISNAKRAWLMNELRKESKKAFDFCHRHELQQGGFCSCKGMLDGCLLWEMKQAGRWK